MKTLLGYVSNKGTVREMATRLAEKLDGDVDVIDLKKDGRTDPKSYDRIVLGGSIHMGRVQNRLKRYCRRHKETLRDRKLGLFLCCLDGEQAEKYMKESFSEELFANAYATGWFGGQVDAATYGPLLRKIIEKVAEETAGQQGLRYDELDRFAGAMNSA